MIAARETIFALPIWARRPGGGAHFEAQAEITAAGAVRPGCQPRHSPLAVVALSALAALLTWRSYPWRGVSAGLNSWQAGLAVGFERHLQWGPQVIFTFGPLGFVEDILPFYRDTAAIGFVYAVAVTWGLTALIVGALRRSWGLVPAAVMAWAAVCLAVNVVEAPELASGTALGLSLACLWAETERGRRWALLGLAALAGLQVLVELNVGLVSVALLVLTVAGSGARRRAAAVAAASFLAVVVIAWLAAGQSLSNFLSYLRGSLAVTLGYASAMSSSSGRGAEDIFAAVLAVAAGAVYALALRGRPRRQQLAVAVMLACWSWELFKEGFVRHDLHDLTFFALFLVAVCLARLPRPYMAVQGAAFILAVVFSVVANGALVPSARSPLEDARAFGQDVADLALASKWAPVQAAARSEILTSGDELAPVLLRELASHTVAAEPWEDALAFAYPQLRWRPEPVLQSYSAYTSYLDNLDAGFLASRQAPQRILYQPATIDGRDPFWDPPTAQVALYCHYRQSSLSGSWAVLSRVPDRCGPARGLGTVSAHFGQRVDVPGARGALVVATFSLSAPLWATGQGILLKPPQLQVTTWGARAQPAVTYRFLAGTASDDHVVSVPASLGYSSPFTAGNVGALAISGGGWDEGQGYMRVTFTAIPLAG